MKKTMLALLLKTVKAILNRVVTTENYTKLVTWLLDVCQGWALKTENTLDDEMVVKVREILLRN